MVIYKRDTTACHQNWERIRNLALTVIFKTELMRDMKMIKVLVTTLKSKEEASCKQSKAAPSQCHNISIYTAGQIRPMVSTS